MKDYSWIIGGNINMVEILIKKSYTCGRILGRKEKWAWEIVKQLFKLKNK
jgi:hypothetical protein